MEKNSKTVIRLLGIDYPVIYSDSEERMQKIMKEVAEDGNIILLNNDCAVFVVYGDCAIVFEDENTFEKNWCHISHNVVEWWKEQVSSL